MSTNNPFSLSNKTILVTGASSGIGRAIAIECAMMGARLIISGRDEMRLEDTLNKLNGTTHKYILADLQNEGAINELVSLCPILDGLVNCAGIAMPLPFKNITEVAVDKMFNVNFKSSMFLTQKLMKTKKISKKASIVFISSISGTYCSYVGGSLYSATKGAINGLVKGMAIELASKSIRVNTVVPGMIDTEILSGGIISQSQLDLDKQNYPLKRYGKPEEVAYAVIYLLSDASQWVTGSNLLIDGGYTLL